MLLDRFARAKIGKESCCSLEPPACWETGLMERLAWAFGMAKVLMWLLLSFQLEVKVLVAPRLKILAAILDEETLLLPLERLVWA